MADLGFNECKKAWGFRVSKGWPKCKVWDWKYCIYWAVLAAVSGTHPY